MPTSLVHSLVFLLSPLEPHLLIIKVQRIFNRHPLSAELNPGLPLRYSSLPRPSLAVTFGLPSFACHGDWR